MRKKGKRENSRLGLILILGSMAAIGPLSIDMYLPAFNDIAASLNTDKNQVGYTLTSYFIGIGVGQLMFGPLSDRYGRKWPTVIGVSVFALTALAIYFTPSIEFFIGIRVLMALGGCIGMITSKAIVRDLFPPEEIAGIFSTLMLIMGIAPIVGPTLGGYLVAHFSWRAIFLFLTCYAFLIVLSVTFFLKESKTPDRMISLKPRAVVQDYIKIFRNPWFLKYSLAGSLAYAGLFAYISGASFLYMDRLGFSQEAFGWTFGLNAGGYILGAQINRLVLKRWTSAIVSRRTMLFQTIVAAGVIVGYFIPALFNTVTMGGIWLFLFCLGFITPNTTAQALAPFERLAGSASALIGGMQMLTGAVISAIVSVVMGASSLPLFVVMFICSLSGTVLLRMNVARSREVAPAKI
ncbi:multidrug effflux MFS transporter [Membranicola marinus]|uniref:Multidrug effflux MFS transporter n=1 Tax=Membranihabitans marinus TaxID=1227546 RepID=A0A953LAT5_9BACT|nr:multidrug effflux MFS transporter [Membranihabitans marinus]MBY5957911.1 multidrug effflux MFS transporter [Membranihabitans marinus]